MSLEFPRIALTGRGGSGKSTLAHDLSRTLELPYIHEVVRTCAANMGVKNINDLSREERIILQTLIAIKQRTHEDLLQREGFLVDRHLYDARAYWRAILGEIPDSYMCLTEPTGYDLVMYVPPFGQVKADSFRLSNQDWEAEADNMMQQTPNAHPIQEVDREARLKEALQYLQIAKVIRTTI